MSRRNFLRGGAAGIAGVAAASGLSACTDGKHATAATQYEASYAAFDITAGTTGEITDLLRTLDTHVARLLTSHVPAAVGISAPPSDSGTLGPVVEPGSLTISVGYGVSFFDKAFGDRRPTGLAAMRTFPNDALIEDWCHGDLLVEIRASRRDVVLHALRDITRATRGGMQIKWRQDGFIADPRPEGAPRNHFGFKDGIVNPVDADYRRLTMIDDPAQPWTAGGSFLVVRLIRMLTEFWDRISISEQENIFGRSRDSGAPLDGDHENNVPRYELDPTGEVIPLTAHIRLANPRQPATDDSRIFRRAYNYSNGMDDNGNLDMGLIFTCLQADIRRQFEAVQTRLIDEPLTDYISPFGGGYFYLPPVVSGGSITGGIV